MTHDYFPAPDRKASHDAPTSVVPHPRHRARRLFDAQSPTARANHPVYNDYELHLVDDNFDDNHFDDNRSRTSGANVSPTDRTPGAVDGGLHAGDRVADPRVLGPVRSGDRAVGDRDRLAREQLSTGRRESHWLLLDLPNGVASACGPVHGSRVSRLVGSALRRQGLDSGRSVAVCVLGLVTLATLIWQAV